MYRLTSVIAIFGALIHTVVVVLSKFEQDLLPLMIFTALYLYMAFYLFSQKRAAAWMTFFIGIAGLVITFMMANNNGAAPIRIFHAAAMINFIAAASAFVILWNTKKE